MPKLVDHDERRRQIARAVTRLAAARGLQEVSFREVATEAGMSVALVQHYFGTKHNMLVGTLDLISAAMAERITQRLAQLGPHAGPLEQVREVAAAFIPVDAESRESMLVYHAFAGAALTDPELRTAGAFGQGRALLDLFAEQLSTTRAFDAEHPTIETDRDALALLSLVLGLSLSVLLEQITPQEAMDALDHQLLRLTA